MNSRFFYPVILMLVVQSNLFGQTRNWQVADTILANDLLKRGRELGVLPGANFDSSTLLLNNIIDIYKNTVGLEFPMVVKAYRVLGYNFYMQKKWQDCIYVLEQCRQLAIKVHGPEATQLMDPYAYLGLVYMNLGDYEKSLPYHQRGLELRLKNLGKYHFKTSESYDAISHFLYITGDFDGALEYGMESLNILLELAKNGKRRKESIGLAYQNIAVFLTNRHDFLKAIDCYRLAMKDLQETSPDNQYELARIIRGIGINLDLLGDHKNGIIYYERALDLFKKTRGVWCPETGFCYSNLASMAFNNGDKEQFLAFNNKAIEIWDTIQTRGSITGAIDWQFAPHAHRNFGVYNIGKQDYKTAEKYLLKALSLSNILPSYRSKFADHLELARLYTKMKQPDSAAHHYNIALGNGKWRSGSYIPDMVSVQGEVAMFHFKLAEEANDIMQMQKAWDEWQVFQNIIFEKRNSLGPGDRTNLSGEIRPVFCTALQAQRKLAKYTGDNQYLTNGFVILEKMHALTLYEGFKETAALQYSGIKDSLLVHERALRINITRLEKQLFNRSDNIDLATDTVALRVSNTIINLRKELDALIKTFETDYPDYYRLKYDLRTEDVASVQSDLLEPDQALVEYFVGDSAVFIFTIRKNDYSVLEIKKDFPLNDWVTQLRLGLTGFFTDPNLADQYEQLSGAYTEAAYNIYQKLVAPIAAKLPKKVVFVTDGILGYVPFEALLAEKPSDPTRWAQHHYLQNDHTVSYCYSATMLREMLQHKHKMPPTLPFLGFAPQYDGDTSILASTFKYVDDMRKDLKPLPYSGEEVYRSAKIMGGQVLVGPEATEAAFVERAGQARVVHLATHGQANDRLGDYCFLVFGGGDKAATQQPLLYARDIYNLQLNADLVTLSACETGIGELKGGEGIISLARAFAYAGAKSVVTSLWSVSDAKTKDLMLDFYKNIHKKAPKDAALRQAKLDFLKRNKGVSAHPFYWAGFVGIGDMGALK